MGLQMARSMNRLLQEKDTSSNHIKVRMSIGCLTARVPQRPASALVVLSPQGLTTGCAFFSNPKSLTCAWNTSEQILNQGVLHLAHHMCATSVLSNQPPRWSPLGFLPGPAQIINSMHKPPELPLDPSSQNSILINQYL